MILKGANLQNMQHSKGQLNWFLLISSKNNWGRRGCYKFKDFSDMPPRSLYGYCLDPNSTNQLNKTFVSNYWKIWLWNRCKIIPNNCSFFLMWQWHRVQFFFNMYNYALLNNGDMSWEMFGAFVDVRIS